MSVISTAHHDGQQRDRHIGDHRRDGLAVLGAFAADQGIALAEVGVDAAGDLLRRPS